MSEKFLLAGDIGGTKTVLGLFSQQNGAYEPVCEKIIKSSDITGFTQVALNFIGEHGLIPEACCFGVAGPVFSGEVTVTKLAWHLSEKTLQKELNVSCVSLINDLAATAYSLPILKKEDILALNSVSENACGNRTIIAPGTGLGEVFLTVSDHHGYEVHSSEGGHTLFAPVTKRHRALLEFLSRQYDQVTYDMLCSGRGIPLIYSFLKENEGEREPAWLADKLKQCDDQTPIIFASALTPENGRETAEISMHTIELFVEILASEAANCALSILATGGVFLAGGIPPRIVDFLQRESFIDLFTARKPFQTFLASIPLAVVVNPKSALIGAAYYGMKKQGWLL